jgi:prephenate dehydratase
MQHPLSSPLRQWRTVAFQGMAGAYAHIAVQNACGAVQAVPTSSFAEAIAQVEAGHCDGLCLPVENSTMGRIADIHALLPHTHLKIVGEYYLPVSHCLLGVKGARLQDIRTVFSQQPALEQCKATLQALKLTPEAYIDTAGAAKFVAERNDPTCAALASSLAGDVYGLDVLKPAMNDRPDNTTRFWLLGREGYTPPQDVPTKTTLLFRVRDVPAVLYKALGGFATNGINLSRLESYLLGSFQAAEFLVDIEAHPDSPAMQNAMQEMAYFTTDIRLMGSYPSAL